MNLSLGRTAHLGVLASAFAYTALTFGTLVAPTAAEARAGEGPFYTAELSQPASERTVIAGGVAWTCRDTSCVAPKGNSRAERVCRELNRGVGEITNFTAKGEALDAEELARCNR